MNNRDKPMPKLSGKRLVLIATITIWALPSSAQRPACSSQKTFTVEQIELPELRYRLIDKFGPVQFCDPECPSSCRFVLEQQHAEDAFPQIRRQDEAFRKIVEHLGLGAVREFSGEQKLSVYREYKKLLCGMSVEIGTMSFTHMRQSMYGVLTYPSGSWNGFNSTEIRL